MSMLDAVGSVLDENGKGGYRLDRMAFKDPFDILGCWGIMSGPIMAESPQEREERRERVVILPEAASTMKNSLLERDKKEGRGMSS